MANEIFTLFGRIVTNSNQTIAELGKVEGAAAKTGASMSLGFARANASIQANREVIQKLGATITATGAVLTAAIGGMMRLAQGAGVAAEQLRNQAAMTGLTRQQLQEYNFIAKQAGFSTEAITNASAYLQRNLMGIEQGAGNAAKVMQALGIAIHDSEGNLRPMSDLLPQVISALQGMSNETERNSFAAQVFGRGWKEIAPMLAMTTQEMARQQQAARDLGLVWSDDMFQAADRADAAFDLLNARLQGVAVSITSAVMPIITSLVPLLQDLAAKVKDSAEKFGDWIKKNPELAKGLILVATASGALMLALGPLLIALPNLVTALVAARTAGLTLGAVWTAAAGPAGWIAIAVAALMGLVAILRDIAKASRISAEITFDTKRSELNATRARNIARIEEARAEIARLERSIEDASDFGGKAASGSIVNWKRQIGQLTAEINELTAANARLKKEANTLTQQLPKPVGGGGSVAGVRVGGGGTGDVKKSTKETGDAMLEASRKGLEWLRLQVELAKASGDVAAQQQAEAGYLAGLMRVWERWKDSDNVARLEMAVTAKKTADGMQNLRSVLNDWTEGIGLAGKSWVAEGTRLEELAHRVYDLRIEVEQLPPGSQAAAEATRELTEATDAYHKALGPVIAELGDLNEWTENLIKPSSLVETRLTEAARRVYELRIELGQLPAGSQAAGDAQRELTEAWEAYMDLLGGDKGVAQEVSDTWQHVANNIHDEFANAFAGMMTGARTFQEFLLDVWGAINRAFANMIGNMVADWLFGVNQMRATGGAGGVLGGLIATVLGGATGGAAGAADAATTAAASEGAIEVNGITGEITAASANVYRRTGASVIGARESGALAPQVAMAMPGGPNINLTIQAIDTQSGIDFLLRNSRAVGQALHTALNSNSPVGRRNR